MPAGRPLAEEFKIAAAARAAGALHTVLAGLVSTTVQRPSYFERRRRGEDVRCLYALWHGHLWHTIRALRGQGVAAMVSQHRDGEIIARVLAWNGFRLIRGSSTRGGAQAMRELVRAVRESDGDVAVTVDGPRGPAGVVKDGIVFAASRTGLPIVPLSVWAPRRWEARSWDRMVVGKPFSRAVVLYGDEIRVPGDADREALSGRWTREVAEALGRNEAAARARAEAGR